MCASDEYDKGSLFISIELALVKHCMSKIRNLSLGHVGQTTFATVGSVLVGSHEDTGTARWSRALSSQSLDLSIAVDLVVLEHRHLDLLSLVLDLLWGGVGLLLSLLGSSEQSEYELDAGSRLDTVVGEVSRVVQLLTSKDETLRLDWAACLLCDGGFGVEDGGSGWDLDREGLVTSNKELH